METLWTRMHKMGTGVQKQVVGGVSVPIHV